MPKTISEFVPVQPGATQYIRNKYPFILEFLQSYFEWAEEEGNTVERIGVLLDQRDIDKSLDEFVKYFQYEFLNPIPNDILADKRKLTKHIKDFYRARGSEKSFRLLFRILYDQPVDFYYPKTNILRPSDGKWTVDTVIRTTTTTDTSLFIARQIKGLTSGALASVENVQTFDVNSSIVSEIYLSNLTKDFSIGETVEVITPNGNTAHETVYGLVTGVNLSNPGSGYKSDDIIAVSGGNNTGVLAVDIISGLHSGRVQAAGLANFPQPATIKLAPEASSVPNFYRNMYVEITSGPGDGELKHITAYSNVTKVATLETNWTVLPDINSRYQISIGSIKTVKVKDFGINYTSSIPANFTISGNGDATGNITFGAVGHYSGRYVNTDGFLSSNQYLQDSFFYQDFSYVLKAQNGIDAYRNIVKQLLHPAGLNLFGDVLIESQPLPRKSHSPHSLIGTSLFSGTLPTLDLLAQYAMVENLVDPQKLFDVSGAFPDGRNAVLGAFGIADVDDPVFVSQGIQFKNNFVNAASVPNDNTNQTIVVVAKPLGLTLNAGILGSIDLGKDSSVSGYQIIANTDGSLTFRAQKVTDVQNDLRVSYPAGSINTSNYFFASLRYLNNTVVANLNQQPSIQNSFGSDVDGSGSVIVNSSGYYLGTGGFKAVNNSSNLYGKAIWGATLGGIPQDITYPTFVMNDFFEGIIAYVLLYNRYLEDNEISDTFQFLKQALLSRGITLI